MKKIFLTLIFASLVFSSCDSTDTDNVSTITNYPTFEYDDFVVLPLGSTFEPNAIASEGGESIPVTTSGSVNTNQVGVYDITYSAVNSDGFEGVAFQTVIIHDPNIIGTDVSGNIRDKNNNARRGVISLVEGTTSIFYSTDFGFAGNFPMYFQMNGDIISEIPQNYINSVTSVALTYDPTSLRFTTKIKPYNFGYTFEYY
jgi:hypothetical protein